MHDGGGGGGDFGGGHHGGGDTSGGGHQRDGGWHLHGGDVRVFGSNSRGARRSQTLWHVRLLVIMTILFIFTFVI
jgi:hypothetical protein